MTDSGKRTVYSVSTGEYSDYRVLDLFEDRADADAIAAYDSSWYVQEFDLHAPGTRNFMVPNRRFSASMLINGDGRILDHVSIRKWSDYPGEEQSQDVGVTHRACWPAAINGERAPARVGQPYEVHVQADTEERARKVASERAAKVAAIILDGGTPETPY